MSLIKGIKKFIKFFFKVFYYMFKNNDYFLENKMYKSEEKVIYFSICINCLFVLLNKMVDKRCI